MKKSQSQLIVPLAVGGAGALLSIVTGFVSGVSTGSILVRGLFSGLLAAGFVLLVQWLVSTFLPELSNLNETREDPAPAAEQATGSRVDIVMDDDVAAAVGAPEAGEEPMGAPVSPQMPSGDIEIAESAESVHNNKPNDSDSIASVVDSLDLLPNLDSLEISMGGGPSSVSEESAEVDTVSAEPSSVGGPSAAAAIEAGEHGDPAEIAKAVKTVLARDQQK